MSTDTAEESKATPTKAPPPEAKKAVPVDANKGHLGPPLYGVRSYLHQFYQAGQKNPSIYEEDEGDEYLLQAADYELQHHGKLWYHKPVLWKALVWIGINFLVFGIIGIFVAYLVPREKIYIETSDKHYFIIQKSAEEYNNNLELVKLVALAFFCSGALLTVIALLIPSVIWKECMDYGGRRGINPRGLDIHQPIRVRIRPAAGSGVTLATGKAIWSLYTWKVCHRSIPP